MNDFILRSDNILKSYTGSSKEVVIPEGITAIDPCAFCNNKHIESVKLPTTLIKIGTFAFSNCKRLRSVNFSETNLTEIAYSAFEQCKKLGYSIRFPSTLKYIAPYAFSGCKSIDNIILPRQCKCDETSFIYCKNIRFYTE